MTYRAAVEHGVAMKENTAVVERGLNMPVQSASVEEAKGIVEFFARLMSADNPTSSEKTQKALDWHSTQACERGSELFLLRRRSPGRLVLNNGPDCLVLASIGLGSLSL